MKKEENYTVKELAAYLTSLSYHLTYRQCDCDAFYNPRNRRYILLPVNREKILTKSGIITLFEESEATDLPSELEYNRFTLYLYSISSD